MTSSESGSSAPNAQAPEVRQPRPIWRALALATTVIALLGANEKGYLGKVSGDRPRDELQADALAKGKDKLTKLSLKQKFEAAYITGMTVDVTKEDGGQGILGFITHAGGTKEFKLGSSCLKGTVYDTQTEHGGTAAVEYSDLLPNEGVIHPANERAPSLIITFANGDSTKPVISWPSLPPDEDILFANGCNPDSYDFQMPQHPIPIEPEPINPDQTRTTI